MSILAGRGIAWGGSEGSERAGHNGRKGARGDRLKGKAGGGDPPGAEAGID
jgi:hypothetical protein